MSDGIYSALSGAVAAQRAVEVVANNAANINTVGYRGDRLAFQEELVSAGEPVPPPDSMRQVSVAEVRMDTSPGALEETGNPYHLALQGDGLFALQTPAGERYTRAGSFTLDAAGMLRSSMGHPVLDENGRTITIPTDAASVVIAPDGTIHVDQEELTRLRLMAFPGPNDLEKEGALLLRAAPGIQARPATDTRVVQGSLETSNVNAISGMTGFMEAQRSFDMFHRTILTFRELDQRANQIGGRSNG